MSQKLEKKLIFQNFHINSLRERERKRERGREGRRGGRRIEKYLDLPIMLDVSDVKDIVVVSIEPLRQVFPFEWVSFSKWNVKLTCLKLWQVEQFSIQ